MAKLLALKREIEADAERRAFDQDFAALQAEIGRVTANAYDPQKRRAYADLNALVDMVGPLAAAKGFALTYDAEPSAVAGAMKVTVSWCATASNDASVDVPMDGAGMRGNANMSAAQAHASTITYGRKQALMLVLQPDRGERRRRASRRERHDDGPPPWEASARERRSF